MDDEAMLWRRKRGGISGRFTNRVSLFTFVCNGQTDSIVEEQV